MQALYVDTGRGPVDFTKFVYAWEQISIKKNEPWLFDFSIAQVPGVPGWSQVQRGAYVQFIDPRWDSRSPGVRDGLVFTGYVTEDPEYVLLGTNAGQPVYGYRVRCTSDDYLINSHKVPARTFINKTRGYILRSLLYDMFKSTQPFPFNLKGILDGGKELIYQSDPKKPWTDIAAEFAKADGFTYWAIDRCVFYAPEQVSPPINSDPKYTLVLDEKDPRYNPANNSIKQVAAEVVNDLTVYGLDEPTTVCREEFVSDGYQGEHSLAVMPFGVQESTLLMDDLTGTEIDSSLWEEKDEHDNFIQLFEGALNVIGGPGHDTGRVFLRSLKGIELSGIVNLRDGELYFPPNATGTGIIGGLFTEDDCRLANLWTGWYIDLAAPAIYPAGPGGAFYAGYLINKEHHYILRRQVTSQQYVHFPGKWRNPATGQIVSTPTVQNMCTVKWQIEHINADDPANVIKETIDLHEQTYASPEFVLYAPIVPYSCHLVMNNVLVSKPAQVYVTVDGVSQRVGSYLDGGRCAIIPDGNRAKLAWYAIMGTSVVLTDTERAATEVTTIPARGAKISVSYRRSEKSQARLQSATSIQAERRRFKDDGIRQLTVDAEEVKPSPRSSEECLFVAQAMLADRERAAYEGSFEFLTKLNDPTELRRFPMPGDRIWYRIDNPDGTEAKAILDITQVECRPVGKDVYLFEIGVGPINRFDQAERELYRRRSSTLDEIAIRPVQIQTAELLAADGYNWVPDPVDPRVSSITPTTFRVDMYFDTNLPPGVSGYELRETDSGWGQPNYIARHATSVFWVNRDRRDRVFFVRPYAIGPTGLIYSRRSALVRVVYPLTNATIVSGIDGEISVSTATFWLPLPRSQDFAGVRVVNSEGVLVYQGDGLQHQHFASGLESAHTVSAFVENSRIVITIDNIVGYLVPRQYYTITVKTYNLLNEYGPETTFTATRFTPQITAPPTPDPYDPNIWSWEGDATNWRVNVYGPDDNLENQFILDGDTMQWNVGGSTRTQRVEVEPGDDFGWEPGQDGEHSADDGAPASPALSLEVPTNGDGTKQDFVRVKWVASYNIASLEYWELAVANNGDMVGATVQQIAPGSRQVEWNSRGQSLWFQLRGVNKFGAGSWSARIASQTGEILSSLSPDGTWNWGNPALHPNIRAGGYTGLPLSSVSDGSQRSLDGLAGGGWVNLDLPAAIRQRDTAGVGRAIIRSDMDVRAMAGGQTTYDGSIRGFNALNSNYYLQTALMGVPIWDGAAFRNIIHNANDVRSLMSGNVTWDGSVRGYNAIDSNYYLQTGLLQVPIFDGIQWRTVIHNNHDVRILQSGQTTYDGAARARSGLDGNGYLTSRINDGVTVYNPWGTAHGILLKNDPHSYLDLIGDGDQFYRTNLTQRNGGGYAYNGLDFNGYLRSGILNRFSNGYTSYIDLDDRAYRAGAALDVDGHRINDFRVDRWSIADYSIVGVLFYPPYLYSAGLPDEGTGYDREA